MEICLLVMPVFYPGPASIIENMSLASPHGDFISLSNTNYMTLGVNSNARSRRTLIASLE
jgi:hypothetical protein